MWEGTGASHCPHVHKEVLPKRNPQNQKEEQRTNTKRKAGTFWAASSVGGIFGAVSSIGGTFWAVSSVGGTVWAVSIVGTFWAVSSVGGILLAVSRLGIFLAESVKPEYGGIFSAVVQYGGNALVVGGFPFFGGNDFGGRRYYQIMAVNCYITGTAHQGGNFTAGKIPTITLKNTSACHGPFVWSGPGRADLKIVTGRARPKPLKMSWAGPGRAETLKI